MAGYGMRYKNAAGKTFITPGVAPLTFAKKVVINQKYSAGDIEVNTGVTWGQGCIIFFWTGVNNSDGFYERDVPVFSGGSWKARLRVLGQNNLNITMYVFTRGVDPARSKSTYGIRVRDDSGVIVFDTNSLPLEINLDTSKNINGVNKGFKVACTSNSMGIVAAQGGQMSALVCALGIGNVLGFNTVKIIPQPMGQNINGTWVYIDCRDYD